MKKVWSVILSFIIWIVIVGLIFFLLLAVISLMFNLLKLFTS